MSEIRGMAALQTWCHRATAGYPGVRVDNLTTSFRDGMAFCALIHHYRPDLIDFDSLSKENVYKNNELAFRVAEQELGIPALLDPEDMVSYQIPDRLSVSTYLAQFYHVFSAKSRKSSPSTPAKRLADKVPTSPTSPPKKVFSEEFLNKSEPASASLLRRREVCAICQLPVFLAERLKIGAKVLHRTCFRCARCKAQLTPASCYETENGDHCCEVCPDEEPTPALSPATTDSSSPLSPVSTIKAPTESTSRSLVESEEVAQRTEEGISSGDSVGHDVSEVTRRTRDARPSSVKKLISRFDTGARGDFLARELQMQSERGLSFTGTAAEESVKVAEPDPRLFVGVTEQPSVETPSKAGVCSDLLAGAGAENDESETGSNSPTVDVLELHAAGSQSRNSDAKLDINVEATLKLSDSEIVNKLHSSLNDLSEDILYPKNPPKTPLSERTYLVDPTDNPFETPEGPLPEPEDLESPFAPECHPPPKNSVEPDENPFTCPEEPSASLESSLSSVEKPATSPEEDIPHDKIRTPFEESDEEAEENERGGTQEVAVSLPVPSPRRRGKEKSQLENYPEDLNPFDNDLETDPETRDPAVLESSGPSDTSLNPFGEEGEDLDETNPFAVEDDVRSTPKSPVPTPRKSLMSPDSQRSFFRSPSPSFSVRSSASSYGKKRLAPPPPGIGIDSRSISPVSTISRYRKDRRAPPPPKPESQEAKIEPSPLPDLVSMNTTPRRNSQEPDVISDENCRKSDEIFRKSGEAVRMPEQILSGDEIEKSCETEGEDFQKCEIRESRGSQGTCHKSEKDKLNENRKSSSSDSSQSKSYTRPNKDSYGQWKRKKAPAPPRPLPQKRQLRKLPMRQIQQELSDLEVQQSEMERQGVALERQIRAITESSSSEDDNSSQSLKLEAEDLILQLFDIVNEKNELLRRQTELMYLKRQQRLEEEYIELEYQIRCLLDKSENCRTEEDKSREDELIQRLVLVVERRAEIVDCLELERRRGEEEDTSIKCHLEAYNLKHDQPSPSPSPETPEQPKSTKLKFKSPAKLLMKVGEHKKKTRPEGENQLDKKTKSKWFKK